MRVRMTTITEEQAFFTLSRDEGDKVPVRSPVDTHLALGVGQRGHEEGEKRRATQLAEMLRRAAAELEQQPTERPRQERVAGRPLPELLAQLGGLLPGEAPGTLLDPLDDPTAPPF